MKMVLSRVDSKRSRNGRDLYGFGGRDIVCSAWRHAAVKSSPLLTGSVLRTDLNTGMSADMFLGVPFNIASYSLLLHYIAHSLNMVPHSFIWNGGDCHIYNNHIEQMVKQIKRINDAPRSPQIRFKCEPKEIWDYTADDFEIVGYEHMGKIQGDVAV